MGNDRTTTRYLTVLLAVALLSLVPCTVQASSSFTTEEFTFEAEGLELHGMISRPQNVEAHSIVIIVHGYGRTNVVQNNGYQELRSRLTAKGIAVVVWDKPGCGKSEGTFDINQPVESSADEVIAAIRALRENEEAGSEQIGLWGVSRAGWIAPLVIHKEPSISFWISVSGTDAFENWGYLLRSNLEIEGYAPSEIEGIHHGWIEGNRIFRSGGSFEEYTSATLAFKRNPLVQKLMGQEFVELEPGSEAYEKARLHYLNNQKAYMAEGHLFDEKSGLQIIISDFDQMLQTVSCPVLALFGSKDSQVDWRKTKKLYENTIGLREDAQLSIKVFPNADHNMRMSKTGGFFETHEAEYWNRPYADGYYEAMVAWLCDNGFCENIK